VSDPARDYQHVQLYASLVARLLIDMADHIGRASAQYPFAGDTALLARFAEIEATAGGEQ
jgi:hypothetical protein